MFMLGDSVSAASVFHVRPSKLYSTSLVDNETVTLSVNASIYMGTDASEPMFFELINRLLITIYFLVKFQHCSQIVYD